MNNDSQEFQLQLDQEQPTFLTESPIKDSSQKADMIVLATLIHFSDIFLDKNYDKATWSKKMIKLFVELVEATQRKTLGPLDDAWQDFFSNTRRTLEPLITLLQSQQPKSESHFSQQQPKMAAVPAKSVNVSTAVHENMLQLLLEEVQPLPMAFDTASDQNSPTTQQFFQAKKRATLTSLASEQHQTEMTNQKARTDGDLQNHLPPHQDYSDQKSSIEQTFGADAAQAILPQTLSVPKSRRNQSVLDGPIYDGELLDLEQSQSLVPIPNKRFRKISRKGKHSSPGRRNHSKLYADVEPKVNSFRDNSDNQDGRISSSPHQRFSKVKVSHASLQPIERSEISMTYRAQEPVMGNYRSELALPDLPPMPVPLQQESQLLPAITGRNITLDQRNRKSRRYMVNK